MDSQKDKEAIYKLAQVYKAVCEMYLGTRYLEVLSQKEGNVNYAVPIPSFLSVKKPEFAGNTALHFAVERNKIKLFQSLMNLGADVFIKNKNGMNALHLAIHKSESPQHKSWKFNSTLVSPTVDLILAKQISSGNSENPHDKNGISHFHAACMINNAEAVEYFLSKGVSVDHAINVYSPIFPGCTPLLIAAKCSNVETAEVLIKYGADIRLKDHKKMTPLHVLLEENADIVYSQKYEPSWSDRRPMINVEKNERIICSILTANLASVHNIGLSPLHAACTTKNTLMIENLIKSGADVNQAIDKNSNYRPGYTVLHFAALFNLDVVKLLLKYGSDLGAKDAEGVTPLEICLENQEMKREDIHFVVSHHPVLKDSTLSDNETKFIDLLSAMENTDCFKTFVSKSMNNVNIQIPADSCIWPGYTPLHLAMTFYKRIANYHTSEQTNNCLETIRFLLNRVADVTVQDNHGFTPLHLAFQLGRTDVVNLICEHHEKIVNPTDRNGLSHLHIACAEKSVALVKKFLSNGVDVSQTVTSTIEWPGRKKVASYHSVRLMQFLPNGTTALHIAVASGSREILQMLLSHGADIYAKDVNGMTPMHWILTSSKSSNVREILPSTSNLTECVSKGGLSLLHIASITNDVKVVEKLLDSGVDVDTKVTYKSLKSHVSQNPLAFLSTYTDFTALHFAMEFESIDVIRLLVDHEADILAKFKNRYKNNFITPLYDVLSTKLCRYEPYREDFISMLKSSSLLQKRVEDDSGLTMLHLACWEANFYAFKELLKSGANVNAQLHLDSPMWPGFTPMNLLLITAVNNFSYDDECQRNIDQAIRLFLDSGADITLATTKNDTLIHYADRILCKFDRRLIIPDSIHRSRLNLLLNRIDNFSENPVNNSGISIFHIACKMNNTSVIKKFLEHQVDVRKPIDHFGKRSPGSTPLHLALDSNSKQVCGVPNQLDIINMLIMHGADVVAEDSFGNTPFHAAAWSGPPRKELFQVLLSHGANILAKNIKGKTPLQILLNSKNAKPEEIKFLLKNGCGANMFNPISEEGYLAMALNRNDSDDSDDESHDSRKIKFEAMINSTLPKEDELGRSVLHNIVSEDVGSFDSIGYADIIEKFKSMGYFIDCQDRLGRTPLHTAAQFRNWYAGPGLLLAGSDANILDSNGRTAFECTLGAATLDEHEREDDGGKTFLMRGFSLHIHKLLLCGLDVDQRNKIALQKALATEYFYFVVEEINRKFYNDVEKTKGINIGPSSLTLYDFLSETGAVSAYPHMTQIQKNAITKFFEVDKRYRLHHELVEVAGILKLQYRKAIERLELIEPAKYSLVNLIRFPLPELCSLKILRYLSTTQLQNLIKEMT